MEKSEFVENLKKRTKQLAVDVILFYDAMKKTDSTRVIGRQLISYIYCCKLPGSLYCTIKKRVFFENVYCC